MDVVAGSLLTHCKNHNFVGQGDWGPPPLPQGRPKLTGYFPRNICCVSGAQYMGAWEGIQIGPTSSFTLLAAMHGTTYLSWIRGTYLTPGAPSVTCLCCTRPSTTGTSWRTFSYGERKVRCIDWWSRRNG